MWLEPQPGCQVPQVGGGVVGEEPGKGLRRGSPQEDGGKAGPGIFRRPGVQHRVPAEQSVLRFHPQPVQGGQQSLRIGFVARHVCR